MLRILIVAGLAVPGLGPGSGALAAQEDCPAGESMLRGRLTDASSGVALPGVGVTLSWMRSGSGSETTLATSLDGTFHICLPEDASEVKGWAEMGAVRGEAVDIAWPASGPVELTFAIQGGDSPLGVASVEAGVEAGGDAEAGGIRGTIRDAATDGAIPGARVELYDGSQVAITDETGSFLLPSVSAGEYQFRVDHLGYSPLAEEVSVQAGMISALTIRLAPQAVAVEPLVVSVFRDARLDRAGFYERMEIGEKIGLGEFMTPETIRQAGSPRVSQLLDRVQLLDMIRVCGATCLLIPRVVSSPPRIPPYGGRAVPCPANVYIDGAPVRLFRWRSGQPYLDVIAGIDEYVIPTAIAGIEVYRRTSELPAEFGGAQDGCGAVVIWTS
ncbi:MAG: carboxypeptidase-like regulatory domain-containing protein [Gemmatimonadota bacterium]|nr:carboxypeptidase-like regulatory domain-containing protein [Gemmatimonadota bacterium]